MFLYCILHNHDTDTSLLSCLLGKEERVTRNMKLELTDENLFSLGSCGIVKVQISDRLEESKMVVSPQVLFFFPKVLIFLLYYMLITFLLSYIISMKNNP